MNKKVSKKLFKVSHCFPSIYCFYFLLTMDFYKKTSYINLRLSILKNSFMVLVSEFTVYKAY